MDSVASRAAIDLNVPSEITQWCPVRVIGAPPVSAGLARSRIESAIAQALHAEVDREVRGIRVFVDEGRVWLSGEVSSLASRCLVDRAVRSSAQTVELFNDLVVYPQDH